MNTGAPDTDLVDLAIEFAGLSITVRGAPEQAAAFVRRVSEAHPSGSGHYAQASPSVRGRPVPSEAPSSRSTSTRASVRATFEACPQRWIQAAGTHLRAGASGLSPLQRIQRAWLAGQWARAVLDQRVATPNASENIELSNRFWVVLRCDNCRCPRIFTSSGAFWAAIGQLEGSDTVTHAFPSETEARAYLDSAGLDVAEFN